MPDKHALLSASSAHRWLHCPPSARLCENYEDKGSDYAAEGTDAHSLCEYKLRKALGMEAHDPTEDLSFFNQEMDDCASGYAAYVLEQVEAAKETCPDPVVLIEQRVDFSRWVEQGFGTADCIIIADGILQIIDFKYGLGVLVSAEENPQMMCYGLGALEIFDCLYEIDTVRMTIYQPRRENLSAYELSKDDLLRWADEVLKPAADLAFAGDGNFLCGEWCGFCNNASNINAGTLAMARLPFKVAYGSGNVAGNSALTINYSSAGFTSVPHVVVSYSTTGSNWSGDNGALKVYNKTATGATIIVGGSFNTSRAIDWIAIGV